MTTNHMLLRQTLKLVEYIIGMRYGDAHDSCQRKFEDKHPSNSTEALGVFKGAQTFGNSKLPFDRDARL